MSYNQKPSGSGGSGMGGGVPPNGPNNSQQVAKTLAGIQQQMQNLVHGQNTLPQSSQAELNVFLQQQRFQNMLKQQQLLHFQMQQHQQQQQQQQKDRSNVGVAGGEPLALTRTPAAAELLNKSFQHHQQQPNGSSASPNTALNQFQQQLQALPSNLVQQLQALQYQMQQHQQQQQQPHPQTAQTQHHVPQQQQTQVSLAHQQQQMHGQAQQLQQQKALQQFQQSLRYYPSSTSQSSPTQAAGGKIGVVPSSQTQTTIGNQMKPPNLPPSTQITPVSTSCAGAVPASVQPSTKNITSSASSSSTNLTTSGGGSAGNSANTPSSKQVPTPSISLLPAKSSAASNTPVIAHQQTKFSAGKMPPATSAIQTPLPTHFPKQSPTTSSSGNGNTTSSVLTTNSSKINTNPDPSTAITNITSSAVASQKLLQTNPVPLTKQVVITPVTVVSTPTIPTTSENNTQGPSDQTAAPKLATVLLTSNSIASSRSVKPTSTVDEASNKNAIIDNSSETQGISITKACMPHTTSATVGLASEKKEDNIVADENKFIDEDLKPQANLDESIGKASIEVDSASSNTTVKSAQTPNNQSEITTKVKATESDEAKPTKESGSDIIEKVENVTIIGKKNFEKVQSVQATSSDESKTHSVELIDKKAECVTDNETKDSTNQEVATEVAEPMKEKPKDSALIICVANKLPPLEEESVAEHSSKVAEDNNDAIMATAEPEKRQSTRVAEKPKDEKNKKPEKSVQKVRSTDSFEPSTTNSNLIATTSKNKTDDLDGTSNPTDVSVIAKRNGRQIKPVKVSELTQERSDKPPSSIRGKKAKSYTSTEASLSPTTPKAENKSPSDRKSSRHRLKTILYQSPLPELAYITKLSASEASNSPKPMSLEDKLIVFYKSEYLAVRNTEGTFYLCQTMQNVYRTSPRISIRWLSEDANDNSIYIPDFYDHTDIECVLTTVELKRVDKGHLRLPRTEQARIESILKKAIDVEKGLAPRPELTEENPDGLDISLYKDESQIEKKSPGGVAPTSGRKARRSGISGNSKSNASSSSLRKRRKDTILERSAAATVGDCTTQKLSVKKRKSLTKRKIKSKKPTTTDEENESSDDSDAEYKPNQKKSTNISTSKSAPRAQRSPLARARAASPMTPTSGRTKPVPTKLSSIASSRGERANKRKTVMEISEGESGASQAKKVAIPTTTSINSSKASNFKNKVQDRGTNVTDIDAINKINSELTTSSTLSSLNSSSNSSTGIISASPSSALALSTSGNSGHSRPTRSRK